MKNTLVKTVLYAVAVCFELEIKKKARDKIPKTLKTVNQISMKIIIMYVFLLFVRC